MRRRRTATRKSTKTHQNTSNENESEAIIPLLISTISQTIEFLSSNDLLLSPSSTLVLSSLISRSSHSLASLLTSLKIDPTLLLTHSKIPNQPSTTQFPFFRRLLSFPDPSLFISNFHVSKPTFYLLLQTLTPSLSSLSSSPFPPDLKLAAFLFRLAHSAPFSFISHRFFSSSSSSLSCRTFYEVCRSVIMSLHNLLHLSSDVSKVVQGFQWMSLPRCCGVLSFFRIPVSGELRGGTVLGQFVVDSEGRFLDLSVGWHGCMKPEMIIPKTKLYASRGSVSKKGQGYFIGGSYCPLMTWLLTPYKGHLLSKEKDMYNVVHGRGMEIAEKAVRRLRGRWKLLRMEWREECLEALPYVAVVACLLHNYLIMCNETEVVEEEKDGLGLELGFQDFGGKEDIKGVRVRDLLAGQMSQVMMTC